MRLEVLHERGHVLELPLAVRARQTQRGLLRRARDHRVPGLVVLVQAAGRHVGAEEVGRGRGEGAVGAAVEALAGQTVDRGRLRGGLRVLGVGAGA
jgi:hypothetical protein